VTVKAVSWKGKVEHGGRREVERLQIDGLGGDEAAVREKGVKWRWDIGEAGEGQVTNGRER
jgi:hypothetical protein